MHHWRCIGNGALTLQQPKPQTTYHYRNRQKRQMRRPRNNTQRAQNSCSYKQGLWTAKYLGRKFQRQILFARRPTHHDARSRRNDQCRNLRDQTIAHRQQCIPSQRLGEAHIVLEQPNQNSANQVHDQNDDGDDGVAANEFGSAVHRPVEVGFAANFAASRARFAFIDKARIQIGIYGKLLTRHRVQGKARRHFSNSTRALGDHDKVDDDQNQEHHKTNNIVAANQKITEGLDYLARRIRPGVPLHQDDAGGSHVKRQTQQCCQQQHRGEHRKIQWPPCIQAHQHHDHRQRDVEREQHIEHEGGQGQYHHCQNQQHQQRHRQPVQRHAQHHHTLRTHPITSSTRCPTCC